MTTLNEAITQARADHGDESVWSDGGTDWTLDNYLAATLTAHADDSAHWTDADNSCGCALYESEPVYYNGQTICRYRNDQTIDMTAPILRLVATGGTALRAAREYAGLSQAALAKAIDVHPQTISDWERRRKPIPLHIWLAVEHVTGCERRSAERSNG